MKYETATILIAFFGLTSAAPVILKREVPQEQSHNRFLAGVRLTLNVDNPDQISDPVFGLLGNAAAAGGAGSITNLDCLQQATADRAFTNAKAAGDVRGMSDALLYRALERNTQGVGTRSVECTDAAVNPEIGAIKQHQDPASTGAAAENKAIVLELARQLQAVGGDPQEALLTGTFEPGDLNDPTGRGNTCDTANDQPGCIFTLNLLVEDATAAEIDAAVGGAQGGDNDNDGGAVAAGAQDEQNNNDNNNGGNAAPAVAAAPAIAQEAGVGSNVQTFTGALGGAAPAVIQSAGDRPFSVNGATFVNIGAALQRSCAVQNNACSNAVNSGALPGNSVGDCGAQERACLAARP